MGAEKGEESAERQEPRLRLGMARARLVRAGGELSEASVDFWLAEESEGERERGFFRRGDLAEKAAESLERWLGEETEEEKCEASRLSGRCVAGGLSQDAFEWSLAGAWRVPENEGAREAAERMAREAQERGRAEGLWCWAEAGEGGEWRMDPPLARIGAGEAQRRALSAMEAAEMGGRMGAGAEEKTERKRKKAL